MRPVSGAVAIYAERSCLFLTVTLRFRLPTEALVNRAEKVVRRERLAESADGAELDRHRQEVRRPIRRVEDRRARDHDRGKPGSVPAYVSDHLEAIHLRHED